MALIVHESDNGLEFEVTPGRRPLQLFAYCGQLASGGVASVLIAIHLLLQPSHPLHTWTFPSLVLSALVLAVLSIGLSVSLRAAVIECTNREWLTFGENSAVINRSLGPAIFDEKRVAFKAIKWVAAEYALQPWGIWEITRGKIIITLHDGTVIRLGRSIPEKDRKTVVDAIKWKAPSLWSSSYESFCGSCQSPGGALHGGIRSRAQRGGVDAHAMFGEFFWGLVAQCFLRPLCVVHNAYE